jgi:hypothetical protein
LLVLKDKKGFAVAGSIQSGLATPRALSPNKRRFDTIFEMAREV